MFDEKGTGSKKLGVWLTLDGVISAEALSCRKADFLVADMEHSANELAEKKYQVIVSEANNTPCLLRLSRLDQTLVDRALYIGAKRLMFPFVESASDARNIVEATRYPPHGRRSAITLHGGNGWGSIGSLSDDTTNPIQVVAQIETERAVASLDEILDVPGLAAIFVGPSDLAASMGHLGSPTHPRVVAVMERIAGRCRERGQSLGTVTSDFTLAKKLWRWGYSFIVIGSDVSLLIDGFDVRAKGFRPTSEGDNVS